MPDSTSTINTLIDYLKPSGFKSSKGSRKSQRASAGSQILGSSVEFLTPAVMIPTKLAQALLSGQAVFRTKTAFSERLLHGLLSAISIAQLSLQSILLFQDDECQDTKQAICRGLFFLSLLYAGMLLTGWGSSEVSKALDSIDDDNHIIPQTPAPLLTTPTTSQPAFLKKVQGFFTGKAFESSKSSRKIQRASATAQVFGSSFQWLTPAAAIPTKVSQTLLSGYAVFHEESTRLERALHGTLCAVSVSELALHTLLLFQNHHCENSKKNICQAILFLGLIYSGILATGWLSSEVSKGNTNSMNARLMRQPPGEHAIDNEPDASHFIEMESPV